MAFIIGREFVEFHILNKSETGHFFFNHVDILITVGIQNDLDKNVAHGLAK